MEFYKYPFLALIEDFGAEKAKEVCIKYKETIATGRLLYREFPPIRDGLLFATMPSDWKAQLQSYGIGRDKAQAGAGPRKEDG